MARLKSKGKPNSMYSILRHQTRSSPKALSFFKSSLG